MVSRSAELQLGTNPLSWEEGRFGEIFCAELELGTTGESRIPSVEEEELVSIQDRVAEVVQRLPTRLVGRNATVEVTDTLQPGHVSLPNGLGLSYPDDGGSGDTVHGVAANTLNCATLIPPRPPMTTNTTTMAIRIFFITLISEFPGEFQFPRFLEAAPAKNNSTIRRAVSRFKRQSGINNCDTR